MGVAFPSIVQKMQAWRQPEIGADENSSVLRAPNPTQSRPSLSPTAESADPATPSAQDTYRELDTTTLCGATVALFLGLSGQCQVATAESRASPVYDPKLRIINDATGKLTSWEFGIMESAPAAKGPYAPAADATTPYIVPSASETTRFYRVLTWPPPSESPAATAPETAIGF